MNDVYTIKEIQSVIMNQSRVPKHLLDAYDLNHLNALAAKVHEVDESEYLFQLLVIIIAAVQGVEEPDASFITFVRKDNASWHKWVVLAKEYRRWEELLNPLRPISAPVNGDGVV